MSRLLWRPIRGERQLLAVAQVHHVALDVAEPDLRPGDVAQQADLATRPLRAGPSHLDQPRVVVARAVGEVEPQDVRAHLDQAGEHLRVVGGRTESGDDLGAAHPLEATPGPGAVSVEVQAAEELLRLAPAPGRHAQRDVPAPEAVERMVDVITASRPASSRCCRHARAASTLSKSPTTSQSSKRGSPDLQLALAGHAPLAPPRRRRSQLIRTPGRPRRNSSAYSRIMAAASSGVGPLLGVRLRRLRRGPTPARRTPRS